MSNTKNMMPAKQDSALARVALMMPESMLIRLKEEADRRASSVSQIVRDSVFERFERMDREARTNVRGGGSPNGERALEGAA